MKLILIIMLLLSPSKQVELINLSLVTEHNSIFPDFENENFIQNIQINGKIVNISIENLSYFDINHNYRLFRNKKKLTLSSKRIRSVFEELFSKDITLQYFLRNISFYLKDNIEYWENSPFLSPEEVILYKRTNCIGYSVFVKKILDLVDIRSEYASGFYIKRTAEKEFEPIPHRWLEIFLPGNTSFFYDPQYQGFKANYIFIKPGNNFRSIKKFKINSLKRGKKLIN